MSCKLLLTEDNVLNCQAVYSCMHCWYLGTHSEECVMMSNEIYFCLSHIPIYIYICTYTLWHLRPYFDHGLKYRHIIIVLSTNSPSNV